jgi:hypothetical protein
MAGAIRLGTDLTHEEVQQSAVAHNALILLRAAAAGAGLKLTAAGNLSRSVVAEMRECFIWPGFDKAEAFEFDKVINESDFLPLFLVRHVVMVAELLRRHKGNFKLTPAGRRMLEEANLGAVQAALFEIALWHLDLGYFGPDLHPGWPQYNAGVVLWSLSVAANDWQTSARLTRLCTIPIDSVVENKWEWDTASSMMEAKILRPLEWFGLLEHRAEKPDPGQWATRHFYRKTALFDRFLSFDVGLETVGARHH